MKIWSRIFKDNHMLMDTVVEDYSSDTRTHKIFHALEETCLRFDLQVPLWLDTNVRDFKKMGKTRFTGDSFTETIDFDYLEFYIIEEP